ncbi:hypothetical protein LIER_09242 [Lithospermum erythrorhizon]|uniref:Growth-regulating factor n=1 Tax=Lithospermum erythrorhizon TaxID=34254 RepID=A0AAV3PF42_LITER
MAASLQFPFTTAQWKELERQAMIYKYMMESIPVPTHLLFPLTTSFSSQFTTTTTTSTTRGVDLYGWGYSSAASNSKDAEPGRCKRTDGKKWRCSRDVAPNQKYCERHMHRGRPRSRKHVEVQPLVSQNNNNNNNGIINSNKKTRLNNTTTLKNSPIMVETSGQSNGTSHVLSKMNTDLSIMTFVDRDENLVMEDKVMGVEQWPNFINPRIDNHLSLFQQQYEGESMNMFSYTHSSAVRDVSLTIDESQFFLNSNKQTKGGFIDAWSNDSVIRTTNSTNNGSSLSSPRGNISPSSLTLSMEKIQKGHCDYRNKGAHCLSTHSWIPFPSGGGPLAEALHTGGVAETPSNPTANDDSISPL